MERERKREKKRESDRENQRKKKIVEMERGKTRERAREKRFGCECICLPEEILCVSHSRERFILIFLNVYGLGFFRV